MTDLKLLNDPEYRWTHKKEMSEIMPFTSKRRKLKIAIIDYEMLRCENNKKIHERPHPLQLDWDTFEKIVCSVPYKKENRKATVLSPPDRLHFEKRDMGECSICGSVHKYPAAHLHHVVPNGGVDEKNIITLCVPCHQMVHIALYVSGRWVYRRPT